MNERIKALAVEADFALFEDGHFYSECQNERITDQLQKFAELIVAAPKPFAWAVQGCSMMWSGAFAEDDAKAEAKRIGGTCVAIPLYTAPPQREWIVLTDAEILQFWQGDHGMPGGRCANVVELARFVETKMAERNT
jgi:hypothetical protein